LPISSRSLDSGGRSASAYAQRACVARLLDRVGLPGLGDRRLPCSPAAALRRVLLAHALDRARLLILDEPTAGLDTSAVRSSTTFC
jgi:ABC-type Mn2+/Zn2+ transport system ATPase subunit